MSNEGGSATSGAATLTVQTTVKPTISASPASITAKAGGTATFKVTASGSGLSYQWQASDPGKTTWWNIKTTSSGYEGSNTPTLTVNATASRNGVRYRCKVSNEGGSITSQVAMLTVD